MRFIAIFEDFIFILEDFDLERYIFRDKYNFNYITKYSKY